ncbi:hypothetical protein GGI59_002829 [Rhizobium lentis]|uniref:Uncharacterized protein n=1 Tax=Rhizobium lentis TaxID=1138194 RepID=A0A7W8XEP2_9HYPH|nr:hypothetical protein [Rhizobium lentis]MBB5550724.1 hypothetical protein [Rhizobium lentis]MBB5561154.1 hypothetical protein [Rhizobium lentis]MBB5567843.1 hypothetical protein [Rhizobium lentis]
MKAGDGLPVHAAASLRDSSIVEKIVRHAGCSVLVDRRLAQAHKGAALQTEDTALL